MNILQGEQSMCCCLTAAVGVVAAIERVPCHPLTLLLACFTLDIWPVSKWLLQVHSCTHMGHQTRMFARVCSLSTVTHRQPETHAEVRAPQLGPVGPSRYLLVQRWRNSQTGRSVYLPTGSSIAERSDRSVRLGINWFVDGGYLLFRRRRDHMHAQR